MISRFLIWKWRWRTIIVSMTSLIVCTCTDANAFEQTIWDALRSGNHFAVLRHAIAPGTGDPENFKIGDCATQRNLSEEGRKQAIQIGERFRANRIENARILSSQWCRCLETATLLSLGPVVTLPVLNSFFGNYEREGQQTRQLRKWLDKQSLTKPLVLVTHQVNITALTNVFPKSGEMLVIKRSGSGSYTVVGRIYFQI